MATTKSSAKTASAKQSAPAQGVAKARTVATAAKPKPASKVGTPKAAAPKAASAKPGRAGLKKPAGVPPEQRRNYVEMAAYYIAERRGFALGNPLEDWIQAEAEIDRLLAEGRVGR